MNTFPRSRPNGTYPIEPSRGKNQEVCKTQEIYTRSFLDVVRLKKLKSEEIFEIRPAVMELP